jgi:hypothetical protein
MLKARAFFVATMSIPIVFHIVGIAIQPRLDNSAETKKTPVAPTIDLSRLALMHITMRACIRCSEQLSLLVDVVYRDNSAHDRIHC